MRSQRELADLLGVSPQFLSKWKLGKTGLSISTAMRWSTILNVDLTVLLTAKKNIRPALLGLEKKKGVSWEKS